MAVINELHGVGNGPSGSEFKRDMCELYGNAGIPYVRLHDTEGLYGSGEYVNIHCIFPNFNADVNNPESYNFIPTDTYLSFIVKAGTKIFYRFGETIENCDIFQKYIYPPKDYQKWAEICEHIIMHYNEGWANGFHYGIEYFEIWNEPDNHRMWLGTPEEFYELYRVTANHLKKRFPNIKIGGFGSSGFYYAYRGENSIDWFKTLIPFARGFMEYITAPETKAPLDFFSWHCYTHEMDELECVCKYAREFIDSYGFLKAESILDEWNYALDWDWKEAKFRKSLTAAAFTTAALITMQKNSVDKAMYYDAEVRRITFCGLFNEYSGLPEKPYYSLLAFNELKKLGTEIESGVKDGDGIYSLAATDGKETAVLVANFKGRDKGRDAEITLKTKTTGNGACAFVYTLDEEHDLELTDEFFINDKTALKIPKDAVVLIKIK